MSENSSEPQHKLICSVKHAEVIINWYYQQRIPFLKHCVTHNYIQYIQIGYLT